VKETGKKLGAGPGLRPNFKVVKESKRGGCKNAIKDERKIRRGKS